MTETLAIDGGRPVRTKPWQPWPHFAEDEIEAADAVLRSGKVNYWTGDIHTLKDGTKVRGQNGLFEYEFANFANTRYAIAVANGSLAIELCLHALDIGHGDEVIVTSRTYIASASSCAVHGAIPVFADIDRDSQNISVNTIRAVFTPRVKAIVCVHLGGRACEMDEIMDFAAEHGLKVIEDCAQCPGGQYKGRMLGSIGHMAAFSFCQDKIMTTGGEGGMVTTNDPELYLRAWTYKDHGKNFHHYNQPLNHPLVDPAIATGKTDYTAIGTNWRLTEMQAAIGRRQLAKLPGWVATRRRFSAMLDRGFSGIPGITTLTVPPHIFHACYKHYVLLQLEKLATGWTRDRVIAAINAEGVFCTYGSNWAIGSEDAWENAYNPITGTTSHPRLREHLPNDHYVGTRSMMFQVHPTLDEESINDTITAVRKVLATAVKP